MDVRQQLLDLDVDVVWLVDGQSLNTDPPPLT